MARMGHSSTRAALIYLHSTDERQREIADAHGELAAGELKREPGRARNQRWKAIGHATGTACAAAAAAASITAAWPRHHLLYIEDEENNISLGEAMVLALFLELEAQVDGLSFQVSDLLGECVDRVALARRRFVLRAGPERGLIR
jgi:hypothetical protein